MLVMLSLLEIPVYIETMYSEYKDLARDVYEAVKHAGTSERVPAHKDLFKHAEKDSFIYIKDGVFRFAIDGNMVRFYSEFDFVASPKESVPNSTLISDFASDFTVFEKRTFLEHVRKDNAVMEKWAAMTGLESKINLFLASSYMKQIVAPDFELKGYDKGDLILEEGDESNDIFEMVSGSAEAIQKERQLGIINEGEVFGEVSFFLGIPRTATVRALEKCLVKKIHEDNFSDMIRHNPNFIISISKTLTGRIVKLNQMVIDEVKTVNIEFE